jgi:hypothetical protein
MNLNRSAILVPLEVLQSSRNISQTLICNQKMKDLSIHALIFKDIRNFLIFWQIELFPVVMAENRIDEIRCA